MQREGALTGKPLTQAFVLEHEQSQAMVQFCAMRVERAWMYCAEHAKLANYFLDRLIFSRWPRPLARLRMWLFPSEVDHRSVELLRTGKITIEEGDS